MKNDNEIRSLAQTIANQSQAIADGKIAEDVMRAHIHLLQNNIDTLEAWRKHAQGN
jgi:hypothetical protein